MAQEVSRILLPLFDKRLDALHSSINSALAQITTNAQKIADLETRMVACESSITEVDTAVSQRQNAEIILRDKLEDLENRERRNNLRFIGIPEEFTGDSLLQVLVKDIPSALQMDLTPDPLMIERAHRIGPPRRERDSRPRPVIARFLNWTIKERFLRAYRNSASLQVNDHKILIFQDFSALVTARRKAFVPVCRSLHNRNIRFQLLYPAKLRVTMNGKTTFYEDPTEASRSILGDGDPA